MTDAERTFGKYIIIDQLGRGGFATVYRARDTTLDREVALKILHPHYTIEPDVAERFLQEAKTVASLKHPNIVTLYEIGDLDGQLFIAMELVEGGSLYERLHEEGPFTVDQAVALLAGVGDALDYAHGRDIIHRDVKPANILLRPTHRHELDAVLTDFGLVKALSRSTQLTQSGAILGTLEYMAPEQIDSDLSDQIGPATDIYALGVVTYQMLTGEAPFTGSTVQIMNGHLHKTPPSPAEIRSEVSQSASDAILKAMAKDPADRYGTAAAFVNALRTSDAGKAVVDAVTASTVTTAAVTQPEPVTAGPPPPLVAPPTSGAGSGDQPPARAGDGKGESGGRSRKTLFIAAGIIIGLLLLVAVVSGVFSGKEPVSPVAEITAPVVGIETAVVIIPTDTPSPDETPTPDLEATAIAATATAEAMIAAVRDDLRGQIVFSRNTAGGGPNANEIYLYDLETGETVRLTDNKYDDHIPRWSPDGSVIAFTSNRSGKYDIWTMNADGGNQQARISSGGWDEYASWDPAGQPDAGPIAFVTTAETEGVFNSELHVDEAGNLTRLTLDQARSEWPTWLDDSSAIVYSSDLGGDMDLYLLELDTTAQSSTYGISPAIKLYGTAADENEAAYSAEESAIVFTERADSGDAFGKLILFYLDDNTTFTLTDAFAANPSWSPDGDWIIFSRGIDSDGDGELTAADESDIWAIRSDGFMLPLVEEPGIDKAPSWGIATYHPTATPLPPTPEGDSARITNIDIYDGRYIVDFETEGFTPKLPGQHVHFFFDTVPPEEAGVPGDGPWQIYPTENGQTGESPFTLYRVDQHQSGATQMCVLVANADHSVQLNTGNCFDLP